MLNHIKTNCNVIETYNRDRQNVNLDSKGIHFVIDGKVKVINSYDDYVLKLVSNNEMFGGYKYLLVKGFSYFGDICASSSAVT
mgnify:CR=1 FL=1